MGGSTVVDFVRYVEHFLLIPSFGSSSTGSAC